MTAAQSDGGKSDAGKSDAGKSPGQTGGESGGQSAGDAPDRNQRLDGYARSLFAAAQGEGVLDRVVDELFHFARAYERHDSLRQTLSAEQIPPERRQAIVEEILGGRASPLTAALISFVIGAGRARDLVGIIDRLVDLHAKEQQKEVAEVRSAVPLDEDARKRLTEALSSALGKQVDVKVIVDPSVLGGVIAKIGDTVLDGSVRHRLDRLREVL